MNEFILNIRNINNAITPLTGYDKLLLNQVSDFKSQIEIEEK